MNITEYNTEANRHEVAGLILQDMAPDERDNFIIQALVDEMYEYPLTFKAYVDTMPGVYDNWEDERLNPDPIKDEVESLVLSYFGHAPRQLLDELRDLFED